LAKEVKDSSLTILFSHKLISIVEEGDRCNLKVFCRWGALFGGDQFDLRRRRVI
jgi:hypothetical protein